MIDRFMCFLIDLVEILVPAMVACLICYMIFSGGSYGV